MSTLVFLFVLLIIAGFFLLTTAFVPLAKKYEKTQQYSTEMMPFPYIFAVYAVSATLLYFFLPNNDFIEPLSLQRVLLPLGLTLIVFVSGIFCSPLLSGIILTACVAAVVLAQPLGEGFLYNLLPQGLSQIALIIFFSAFCLLYKLLNYLSQTMTAVSILLLTGLSLLSLIGAAPTYPALCAAVLIGALVAYLYVNFTETKLYFDNNSCTALAFLICSLMLFNAGEFCLSSCVVFSVLVWAEALYALWNRFIQEKEGLLTENTAYATAAQKYTMKGLISGIVKIGAVCLFLGWFQLFSANQYSLFIVALCIVLWLNNNLAEVRKAASLKEVNQDFITEVKKNFDDVKTSLNTIRDKKDKE